jgi:membrane protein YqaA with SNARE-associated domain
VNHILRLLIHIVFRLNYFGPFVMGVMDSSFLLLPLGNDLVVVSLVIRNHHGYPWYVLAAVAGAVTGTFLLDLVARHIGETGVQHVAGQRRFEYLKKKIGQKGGYAVAVACLSPPPFPFTAVISTVSALSYSRKKLLIIVGFSRAIRFLILGWLAIRYGKWILRVANSAPFKWTMLIFVGVCVVGSVFSLLKWFRRGKQKEPDGAPPGESSPAASSA